MSSYVDVRGAFYSGVMDFTGDAQMTRNIAFLVDESYLTLRIFSIANRKTFTTIRDELDTHTECLEASGGSKEHVTLKLLAANYLREQGHAIRYEHSFCGYFPDVMTLNGAVIAECGHTHNPEKMIAYFRDGGIKECIGIPYPDPEKELVLAYSFMATDTTKDFLTFWAGEERADLAKKLKGRQRN